MTEPELPPALGVIEQRPEHARALGLLVSEWAHVERRLEQCLAFLLYVDEDVARAIYQNFPSTRAKIELLIRLNNLLTPGDENKIIVRRFLDLALDHNSMRNAYVHASWAVSDDRPGQMRRVRQSLPSAKSSKSEHESEWMTAQRILDDALSLAKWHWDFFNALFKIDPERLNKPRRST